MVDRIPDWLQKAIDSLNKPSDLTEVVTATSGAIDRVIEKSLKPALLYPEEVDAVGQLQASEGRRRLH